MPLSVFFRRKKSLPERKLTSCCPERRYNEQNIFGEEKNAMSGIIGYYEQYDEDERLTTDPARNLEFLTTVRFLEQHLPAGSRILDLGAGAGIYTFHFADRGHAVCAADLTPKHIRWIQERVDEEGYTNIEARVANALDLSGYADESFDAVLCLGPVYHLLDPEDQRTCIRESLRVLKPGGVIAVAYINRLFIFPHLANISDNYLDDTWVRRIAEEKQISSADEDCFWTDAYFHTPDEIEALLAAFGVTKLVHAGSDGVGILLRNRLNGLSGAQFAVWRDYHFRTCTEPSILGISNHGLYLGRK